MSPLLPVEEESAARLLGKYRGVVTDDQDPRGVGRVRAKVPEALGEVETGWALPCVPYAGDGVGLWLVPPPGTGVWVEFEGGDPGRPVWTGCWWGEGQPPADATTVKVLQTASGHVVRIDDDAGTVEVLESGGGGITLTSDGITLESNGCKVEITASGVTIDGGGGKVEVTSSSVSVNNGALEVS